MTVFSKIIQGELPASIVYEDDLYMAFKDIHPQMKTHLLIIPKATHIASFASVDINNQEDRTLVMGLFAIAWKIIEDHDLQGCKLELNSGADHGQEIFHIHLHLMSHDSLKIV